MNTAALQTKRKNIDIREDVYRFLSIKAAASASEASVRSSNTLSREAKLMTKSIRRK